MCRVSLIVICFLLAPGSEALDKFFASKTSYLYNGNTNTSPITMEGCTPILLYIVARHGARNPGTDDIEQMLTELPGIRDSVLLAWADGQGQMTEQQIEALLAWQLDLEPGQGGDLVPAGRKEHGDMAGRWLERLNASIDFSPELTEVRSSSSPRCVESGEAFLEGLGLAGLDIHFRNEMINFSDYCPRYDEEVGNNPTTNEEVEKLEDSSYWRDMMDRVNTKTGVLLDRGQNNLAWDMCRHERAWVPEENSPWCFFFSPEDHHLYNFREDLKYYYNNAYAHNITFQMTQPLLSDLLSSLHSSNHSVLLNFGHTDTVQPLLAALGLYRDQSDLLASDYDGTRQLDLPASDYGTGTGTGTGHLWDVSRIGSFASNLAWVVFQCGEERRVIMFHQETAVVQPACGGLVCTLQQLVDTYSPLADADFTSTCSTSNDTPNPSIVVV